MKCYGRYESAAVKCRRCQLRKYCRTAGDLELLPRGLPDELGHTEPAVRPEENDDPRRYTRSDLLEIIRFMAALDVNILQLLDAKMGNPDATCQELAGLRGLSRQAVHKAITKWCRRVPELESLLANRQCPNRSHGKTTFMEEVCKIRQRLHSKESKMPKPVLNCFRSLISWRPSLSLSGMSIFRGSAILRKD